MTEGSLDARYIFDIFDILERLQSPNGIQKYQKYRHSIQKYQKYRHSIQKYQKYRFFDFLKDLNPPMGLKKIKNSKKIKNINNTGGPRTPPSWGFKTFKKIQKYQAPFKITGTFDIFESFESPWRRGPWTPGIFEIFDIFGICESHWGI